MKTLLLVDERQEPIERDIMYLRLIIFWTLIETLQIIKWSGISPYLARLWLAETAFTRVYLRVSRPQTAFSGLFGVSIFSHARLTAAGAMKKH